MPYFRCSEQKPELKFNLIDLARTERYQIWNNETRKFLDSRNTPTISGKSGKVHETESTKFLNKDVFAAEFPNCSKKSTYERNAVVDGTQGVVTFGKRADDDIERLIQTIQQLGQDPLSKTFVVKRSGSGLNTRYSVEIVGDAVQQQKKLSIDLSAVIKPSSDQLVLNEVEKELVKQLKGTGMTITEDIFVKVCKDNDMNDVQRAKTVFQQSFGG